MEIDEVLIGHIPDIDEKKKIKLDHSLAGGPILNHMHVLIVGAQTWWFTPHCPQLLINHVKIHDMNS